MKTSKQYWKSGPFRWCWKSTTIDFALYKNSRHRFKLESIFRYLPLPFDEDKVYFWENGQYSAEYNEALFIAIELELVEVLKDEVNE